MEQHVHEILKAYNAQPSQVAVLAELILDRAMTASGVQAGYLALRLQRDDEKLTIQAARGAHSHPLGTLVAPEEEKKQIGSIPLCFQGHCIGLLWVQVGTGRASSVKRSLSPIVSAAACVLGGHLLAKEVSDMHDGFLATISHEIRTPLNGIIGMTKLVLNSTLSQEQRSNLNIVFDCGFHLVEMINDILDFSRMGYGKLTLEHKELDPRAVISSTHDLMKTRAREKGVVLTKAIHSGVPYMILGDGKRFRQVLVNLLSNALKFTAPGGHIVTRCNWDEALNHISVEVEDTGIGIPESAWQAIFEPFRQSQPDSSAEGTGLGLAICKKLLKLMNGKIFVKYSQIGQGTCFYFSFPTTACTMTSVPTGFEDSLRDKVVLVLDPGSAERIDLLQALLAWGMRPTVCSRVDEVKMYVESDLHFHVGFVHSSMLVESADIRQQQPIPLIALSANHQPHFTATVSDVKNKSALLTALYTAITGNRGFDTAPVQNTSHVGAVATRTFKTDLAILVVEDSMYNLQVAVGYLKQLGYAPHCIDIATNGIEAVTMARNKHYDVIFMDLKMPKMNGFDATRSILAEAKGIPNPPVIFAMTAYVMDRDRKRCQEVGMKGFIAKPLLPEDMEILLSKVRRRKARP